MSGHHYIYIHTCGTHTGLGTLGVVGGGKQHTSTSFAQEWIFNKLFNVWEHQSLLLQLSGYN